MAFVDDLKAIAARPVGTLTPDDLMSRQAACGACPHAVARPRGGLACALRTCNCLAWIGGACPAGKWTEGSHRGTEAWSQF